MKKTNKLCFSNGSEFMDWMHYNCYKCIKSSKTHTSIEGLLYETSSHCKIYDEIIEQSITAGAVSERTFNATQQCVCPLKKEHWNKRKVIKKDNDKSLNLF